MVEKALEINVFSNVVSSAFEFLRLFSQLHLALFKIVLPFVVNVILLALVAGPEANLHDP